VLYFCGKDRPSADIRGAHLNSRIQFGNLGLRPLSFDLDSAREVALETCLNIGKLANQTR